MLRWAFLLLVLTAAAMPLGAHAQAPQYTVQAVATATPPPMDGDAQQAIWKRGSHATLDHDFTYKAAARANTTDVYVMVDKSFVYIAWICRQDSAVIGQQLVNDSGTAGDDDVSIVFWPGGVNGNKYTFSVMPTGAHDQSSTENTAYAPRWDSVARRTATGYEVTARIPLSAMRTDGRSDWSVQFVRYVAGAQDDLVWAYDAAMAYPTDPLYAGTFVGIGKVATHAALPRPRVQLYGLAQAAAASAGGPSSRLGLDYSIPISRTASLYGTVHPDYSEVEYDQQSISPTEFSRFYREVRPFFTQGANYFNPTGFTDLYTPSVPTPRYGYAVEGANNGLHYIALNAIGDGRDDNALATQYVTADQKFSAAYQRTAVELPGISDVTQSASLLLGNGKHFSAYTIFGVDDNSALPGVPNKNRNVGATLYDATSSLAFNWNSTDAFYTPLDGYVTVTDERGYNLAANKTWNYGAGHKLQSFAFYVYADRYHDAAGSLAQSDTILSASATNRHKVSVYVNVSSSYLLISGRGLVPFNQPSVSIYDSADPARTFWAGTQYGHFLNGFERYDWAGTSWHVTKHASVEINVSRNVFDNQWRSVQSLQYAALTLQFGRSSAFSLGARRIEGAPAAFTRQPAQTNTNLSASFNERFSDMHLYAVYGDPNALSTSPAFVIKLVRFVGADEGT